MQKHIQVEFQFKYTALDSDNEEYTDYVTKYYDVSCEERIEECHGFHTFYDLHDEHYEEVAEYLLTQVEDDLYNDGINVTSIELVE